MEIQDSQFFISYKKPLDNNSKVESKTVCMTKECGALCFANGDEKTYYTFQIKNAIAGGLKKLTDDKKSECSGKQVENKKTKNQE